MFQPPFPVSRGNPDVNLIKEQIRLALGDDLGYTQDDITFEGVGIEYRIIAEDTDEKFAPWAGKIEELHWDEHEWLKMHTHIPKDLPYQIPTEFDPNLALAIIWGKDLEESKKRGLEFLNEFVLEGKDRKEISLKSNLKFLAKKSTNILEF